MDRPRRWEYYNKENELHAQGFASSNCRNDTSRYPLRLINIWGQIFVTKKFQNPKWSTWPRSSRLSVTGTRKKYRVENTIIHSIQLLCRDEKHQYYRYHVRIRLEIWSGPSRLSVYCERDQSYWRPLLTDTQSGMTLVGVGFISLLLEDYLWITHCTVKVKMDKFVSDNFAFRLKLDS